MPPNDVAISDQVLLQCPACGASEAADVAMLADAPTIVCRNCGETWPTGEPAINRQSRSAARPPGPRPTVEAVRKPLVTYSGSMDPAWAAKLAGDKLPAGPRRRSRVPRAMAALASSLFIAAFFAGREAAVAALPDLAGLYDSLGIPVNLDGLEIRDISAERSGAGGAGRVAVRGEIFNASRAALPVPPLQVSFLDATMEPAGSQGFDPPGRMLKGSESAPFSLELDDVPHTASTIVLRFRRDGEPGPLPPGPDGASP